MINITDRFVPLFIAMEVDLESGSERKGDDQRSLISVVRLCVAARGNNVYRTIFRDGRIWKERVSAGMRRGDLQVMKEGEVFESEAVGTKPRPKQYNRMILPSLSAPEHNLLNLLEECNASGI
ncbi:hypothetical protein JRO89_XS01G0077100 [Xanthoceras sorbifolium]|uniref:Single-stranded DNA binding protein n=1 Tax=Xanthoceras sorbifolium TaxID=99658 RepID=A0ABQ8IJB1_9ROSI|nr:hypothetical protein JRO89_XS01G0077100 [Xanthoceras sorbifolium]